ncbi:disulfide reductase [Desulfopila sp. IMCC35006]|uniref:CoB--CoM heterodisulfide reductase iron-sulfur subunit B family protein n=1 Tax=Desulfopila sp. IMCC35006 TaxID=2569542 RepID=UPI0010AC2F98|nr:heterodisulfide reductase-related iron-sulfur binding cluster [Desulfopila sp. IMCC35006]TKB26905.1 disulfide reductase [Desulfopila sp. IMCC35006]
MKLSYYPGCSLEGTALDYDHSVREICAKLAVELVDIPDWNCCGASSAHMTDHEIGLRLPMRNLLLAAEAGHDILVPCAACFQRLKAADKALRENPVYWDVDATKYSPAFEIIHISTLLAEAEILAAIKEQVVCHLDELAIACYYGCLSLRNPRVTDAVDWEMPQTLERIVAAVGARPVNWSHRTECCSGSLTMARPDIAEKLVGDIVTAAKRAGAGAMVTDCPMCQANVESRQTLEGGPDAGMPVFYATELIAAALSGSYPVRQQKVHLVSPTVLSRAVTGVGEASSSKEDSR